MKAKEALIRKSVFPKPLTNLFQSLAVFSGLAYIKITKEIIAQVLTSPAPTKGPGQNKINFLILQMIWSWKKAQIISMIYHAIRLGYHLWESKKALKKLFEKGGKQDFRLVRSY